MGCVSSKILAKSGSFQEKVSLGRHSFQRSSAIEEMILSTSKSNGDQFLALLRTSTSSARKAKQEPEVVVVETATDEPAAKIETIDVSELLAGLEEEESCTAEEARERRQSISRNESPAPSPASGGRARSFRTVEEFDAMLLLTQQQQTQSESESGSSSGRPAALVTEQEEDVATTTAAPATDSTAVAEVSDGSVSKASVVGAKRRARARQLGELNVPAAAFDFCISKSGSLRDWLRQGGQIFSPGSYVTPRFGKSPSPAERGGGAGAGEHQQQQALFDLELVAQFERAMEQLSEDEGRVLDEILEALELEAAEMDGATVVGKLGNDQPAAEPVLVQQVIDRVSAELELKTNG